MGIFPFACEIRKDDKPITTTPGYKDPCQEWWDNLTGWQKGVAAAMCLAVLVEIIALIWNIVTFCACCCKKYIIHPLVAFAFLIAILHLIALIIYGLKYKDQIDFKNLPKDPKNSNNLGYSFYMAIVAMIGAVLNIFVGGIAVHFAKRDL
uniref:Uncharacterized protein n=1 Tax=Acrobeloides nanus TaxID=290746 RepID=A0A914C2K3_9BILA